MTNANEADDAIVVAKVVWPKTWEGPRNDEQQRSLRAMVRDSQRGMVLDCSGVEVGNSEIINMLMRVRNHAKQLQKELVLYNVPETLGKLIKMCNLEPILQSESDEESARKRISTNS